MKKQTSLIYIEDFFREEIKAERKEIFSFISASLKAVFNRELESYNLNDSKSVLNLKELYKIAGFSLEDKNFWKKHYYDMSEEVLVYLKDNLPSDAIYFSC